MTELTAPAKPGPKPKTLTAEQLVELRALSQYLTQAQIADYFGFAQRTLQNIFEREPDVYASYKRGQIGSIAKSASLLTKLAWGYTEKDDEGKNVTYPPDRASLMFHLKTKGGWRETSALELTGKDGAPLSTPSVDWSKVPTEVIQAVLAAQVNQDDDSPV